MKDSVLFARDKDIIEMGIGWRFYHLFKEPPYMHRGEITLGKDALKLRLRKNTHNRELNLPYKKIKGLHWGFDNVFKRRMCAFRPLKIKYQTNRGMNSIYLFIGFYKTTYFSLRAWTIPKTRNKDWFSAIKKKRDKHIFHLRPQQVAKLTATESE
jgi:hypothetical protein